ncbi:hypothetical protein STENM327S_09513 [Streptomyces tendae]
MKVGDRVPATLAEDGRGITLRVAATYAALPGEDVAYLPERFAGTGLFARDGLVRRASLSPRRRAGKARPPSRGCGRRSRAAGPG